MKKFFEKAKLEIKFRKAGEGHTLNASNTATNRPTTSQSSAPASRAVPSTSAQRAGEAAILRLSQQEQSASKKPQSATATWKHGSSSGTTDSTRSSTSIDHKKLRNEVRQEVLADNKQNLLQSPQTASYTPSQPVADDGPVRLSVDGIYFKCALCPMTVLQQDRDAHLKECLENLYIKDPHMASAFMIQSLNKDKDRIKACVDVLCKYIDNICNNPGEEKYRKIKQSNKIYKERVSTITGAIEFILACGFEDKEIEQDGQLEHFYVLPSEKAEDQEALQTNKAVLLSTEPLKTTLDRNLKVFRPTSSAVQFELPEDFFSLSSEEIKREYNSKLEEIDKQSQLRTKAMREADKKPNKVYHFTLIRVRFPDGVILQGTFYSREKLRDLFEFVRQSLESDWQPFVLSEPTGQLKEEDDTLNDVGLVPAAVVNFAWDANIMADIVAASGSVQQSNFLKPDLMALIQELS